MVRILSGYFLAQIAFLVFSSSAYRLRVDDAYYYFGIARNVVDLGVFTFDGIHTTNGFQPLWQWMLIALTCAGKSCGIEYPGSLVYLYLVFCAVLNTCSAYLALLLSRKLYGGASRPAAVFLFVALWVPGLTVSLLTGMENSLNWLLLLALANVLLDSDGRVNLKHAVRGTMIRLAALSILCVYTRLDNALLLAIMAVVLLLTRRDRDTFVKTFRWGVFTVVGVLPLLFWELHEFGAAMPISGTVKLWRAQQSIASHGLVSHALESAKAVLLSAIGIPIGSFLMGYYEIVKPRILELGIKNLVAIVGCFVLVAAVFVFHLRRRVSRICRTLARPPSLMFWVAVSVTHLVVSSMLFPSQWGYAGLTWYFMIQYLAFFVFVGWAVGIATVGLSATAWRKTGVVAVSVLFLVMIPLFVWRPSTPTEQQLKFIGAKWINENLAPTSRVAARNAGVTGYYAEVPVINLDGLVNTHEFYRKYLRRRRLRDYLRDERVTHIADHNVPEVTPARFYVDIPDEGEILFMIKGNERNLNFGVVEIREPTADGPSS